MKNLSILLFLFFISAVSCKKKSNTPSPPSGPATLNGLTAIRYMAQYDSSSVRIPAKYFTWHFTGTNPISAIPLSDSSYAGYEQMFFTSNNATRLEYYTSEPMNKMKGSTVTITYNASDLPDILSVVYAIKVFGHKKFVFEYTGTQLTKLTEVRPESSSDTNLNWTTPYCYYHYTYTGSNISQMVIQRWSGGSSYTFDTIRYATGSIKNNLSGSFPLCFLLEFLRSTSDLSYDFPYSLPFYLSTNLIENNIKYITDTKGRITHRIFPTGVSSFDTTFYYY